MHRVLEKSGYSVNPGQEPKLRQLTISNHRHEVTRLEKWLADFARETDLSQRNFFALDLVLNEVLINIISYGYDDDDEHSILIKVMDSSSTINAEIIDDAHPFNPLDYQPAKGGRTLQDASIGGRGILLLKKYTSHINYCRSGHKNHLSVSIEKA